MVKHHVKGKKNRGTKEENIPKVRFQENLDRFAGSSDEDNRDSTDDESSVNDESHEIVDEEEDLDNSSEEDEYGEFNEKKLLTKAKPQKSRKQINSDDDDEDTEGDSGQEETDYENVVEKSQSGMAGAMAKILGVSVSTKAKTKQVILSKTITPLQKLQRKEKEQEDALRLKRKQRRDVHLTSMHIPLSAAASRPIVGKDDMSDLVAKEMSKEMESESTHRRVATRGVVALFNTISKHQQQKAQEQSDSGLLSKSTNEDIKAMTKHGFLDMLKKTGSSQASIKDPLDGTKTFKKDDSKDKAAKGWNALKDDFIMNSKLKDWDKAISDDEESDDDAESDARGTKRGADDDDVMEDDWSSDDEVPVSKGKKNKLK